jgi:hypothetical protein
MRIGILGSGDVGRILADGFIELGHITLELVMGTMPLSYYENKEGASCYVTCYISMMITKSHV